MPKLTKINPNTEFQLHDTIFTYTVKDGTIELKKVRIGKIKEPPTLDEVKAYFKAEGYSEESAIKFHKSYSSNEWRDSNNKPVLNWKQKAINVWFTEQNKIKQEVNNKHKGMVM